MPDHLRLALGTLTALPVPPPRRVDRRTSAGAMLLAPLVALVLLVVPAAVVLLARALDVGGPIAAVVCVSALALQTRALHLDGLADTADGLTASYDREKALRIMRTGDVGPAGAATLALTLALQIVCAATLLESWAGFVAAGFAVVVSRTTLVWLTAGAVRPARREGLGAGVVGAVPLVGALACTAIVLAVGTGTLIAADAPWWTSVASVGSAAAAVAALLHRCTTRLGGVTGDVLGAGVELGLAAALLGAVCAVA